MSPDLIDDLVKKYPDVFRVIKHVEAPDGWYDLIDGACHIIQEELEKLPIEFRYQCYAHQIKDKFGGLRFYMSANESTKIEGAIELAEYMSSKICEECGDKAVTKTIRSWIFTLCEKHHQKVI